MIPIVIRIKWVVLLQNQRNVLRADLLLIDDSPLPLVQLLPLLLHLRHFELQELLPRGRFEIVGSLLLFHELLVAPQPSIDFLLGLLVPVFELIIIVFEGRQLLDFADLFLTHLVKVRPVKIEMLRPPSGPDSAPLRLDCLESLELPVLL